VESKKIDVKRVLCVCVCVCVCTHTAMLSVML